MPVWSSWCRLCARDSAPLSLPHRLAKHLSASIQTQMKNGLPCSICDKCYVTLSSFDDYTVHCEKVQTMFKTLLDDKKSFQDADTCVSFRNNFFQFDSSSAHGKLIPFYTIKAENDSPVNEGEKINERLVVAFSTTWNNVNDESSKNDYSFKNESDEDIFNGNDSFSDDDDRLPLASISDLRMSRKRKSKKTKHSEKKRKKNKSKNDLSNLDTVEEVIIKVEPICDNENSKTEDQNEELDDFKKENKKDRKKETEPRFSFDCYICKTIHKNWHALCIHFREVHNSGAKVLCCCGKFLASRISIARHCANHGKTKSFDCTQCSKRFPRERELKTHMISHLPKEEHPYVCCKCAKRFSTQQLLRHHEKKHIPMEERSIHLCSVCQTKFASKSSLLMHIKAIHEKLKPFVCDQCGSAFTTKGILEEHLVRHSDERPHSCEICQKSFKTKQRLSIHLDTHKDTSYQCPHCEMTLNSRRTLRMHMFIHDDFLRYHCNFCSKSFRRAKDLKNHSNLHTGRRPYSCPWCSRTFANGSNCRAHKRRMHPTELSMYEDMKGSQNNETALVDMHNGDKTIQNTPKIIHANIKRKSPEILNIDISPELKKEIIERKHIETTIPNTKADNISTKQEKSSPIHSYESSLSPLNLNTSTPNDKFLKNERTLTVMPINSASHEENFKSTSPQKSSQNFNSTAITNTIKSDYSNVDYKMFQDFSKTSQIFTNFNENNVQNEYKDTQMTFSTYGTQFNRNSEN